jgi:hypothetical protein
MKPQVWGTRIARASLSSKQRRVSSRRPLTRSMKGCFSFTLSYTPFVEVRLSTGNTQVRSSARCLIYNKAQGQELQARLQTVFHSGVPICPANTTLSRSMYDRNEHQARDSINSNGEKAMMIVLCVCGAVDLAGSAIQCLHLAHTACFRLVCSLQAGMLL